MVVDIVTLLVGIVTLVETTCGKRRCCRLLEVHPEKWVELMGIGQFKQVVVTFLICMSINVFTQND